MQLGIKFRDNDFTDVIRDFFQLYILPTFIDRGEGHMITHLTSNMVVEMFNMYMPYLYEYRILNSEKRNWYRKDINHRENIGNYLTIIENQVVWDGEVDEIVLGDGWCSNGDFVYTNGKEIKNF